MDKENLGQPSPAINAISRLQEDNEVKLQIALHQYLNYEIQKAILSRRDIKSVNRPHDQSSSSESKYSGLPDSRTNTCPSLGSGLAPNLIRSRPSDPESSSTDGLPSSAKECSESSESSSSSESLHSESFESSNSDSDLLNLEPSESYRYSPLVRSLASCNKKLLLVYVEILKNNNCSESLLSRSSNTGLELNEEGSGTMEKKSDTLERPGIIEELGKSEESKNSEKPEGLSSSTEEFSDPECRESSSSSESLHSESYEFSNSDTEPLNKVLSESQRRKSEESNSSALSSHSAEMGLLESDGEKFLNQTFRTDNCSGLLSSNTDVELNEEGLEAIERKSEESKKSKECEESELISEENSESQRSVSEITEAEASDAEASEPSKSSELLDSTCTEGPFSDDYCHLKLLRKGTFGYASKGFRKSDGLLVVTKFISKSKIFNDVLLYNDKFQKEVPIEVSLLQVLDHPNIVKVHDVFENDNYYNLVMEKHGCGMDLFDFIDRSTHRDEPLICYIFRQIVNALSYLHSNAIVHRDIKDENCLIDENFHVKLIDFGSAGIMTDKPFKRFYGTKHFCSPEVMRGDKYRGPEMEIFALGVTLYDLAFGVIPFEKKEDILIGKYDFSYGGSEALVDLITGMLEPVPDHRLTLPEVEINKWVNQDVEIENYSFSDVVRATEEELDPDKYISLSNMNEYAGEDTDLSSLLQSVKNLSLNDKCDRWLDDQNSAFAVSPSEKDNA